MSISEYTFEDNSIMQMGRLKHTTILNTDNTFENINFDIRQKNK